MDNYTSLLERIAHAAKLPVAEIERKVEAKRAKLSGLVSREGAAQIVAAELGINFEQERLRISELVQGMKRARVLCKVLEVSPVRTYAKNGKEGKVANLFVGDNSGTLKVVLWDTNHIGLVETGQVTKGSVLELSNGIVRNGELHLSSFADIKTSSEVLEGVMEQPSYHLTKLKDIQPGQKIKARAFVVQVFEPRYFEVCSECGKRFSEEGCQVHGKVQPAKRALLNLVLDDGSETMRAVFFSEQIKALGFIDDEIFSLELFAQKRDTLLGTEKFFLGNLRQNTLYNTVELTVERVEDVVPEQLITAFEKT